MDVTFLPSEAEFGTMVVLDSTSDVMSDSTETESWSYQIQSTGYNYHAWDTGELDEHSIPVQTGYVFAYWRVTYEYTTYFYYKEEGEEPEERTYTNTVYHNNTYHDFQSEKERYLPFESEHYTDEYSDFHYKYERTTRNYQQIEEKTQKLIKVEAIFRPAYVGTGDLLCFQDNGEMACKYPLHYLIYDSSKYGTPGQSIAELRKLEHREE